MKGFAIACSLAVVAAAQQNTAPVTLPSDWAQRDLEGKWVAYRAAIDGNPQQTTLPAAWAKALGDAREFELLEWIVVAEGWKVAGPELVRADAPQLLRAAAWNFANFDSHGKDAAKKVLLTRAGRVLGWLDAHRDALQGPLLELQRQLEAGGARPDRDADDLPPLDPMQMLVPWLDAPAQLADFGARTTAEPKVRYVHQVRRALGAVLVLGDADDRILTKVVALTKHPHATVRYAAFDTLAKLPPGLVPFAALLRLADDAAADAERRRLATMALSFSSHPAVLDVLVRLALDRAHPGHETALTRFAEVGDPVAVEPLRAAADASPEMAHVLALTIARLNQRRGERAFAQWAPLRAMLQRVAWMRVTGDARAAAVWTATAKWLRGALMAEELRKVLDTFPTTPAPVSPFRGDEAGKIEAELQKLARELAAAGDEGK